MDKPGYTVTVESWKVDPKRYGVTTDLKQIVHMKFVVRNSLGQFGSATNYPMK